MGEVGGGEGEGEKDEEKEEKKAEENVTEVGLRKVDEAVSFVMEDDHGGDDHGGDDHGEEHEEAPGLLGTLMEAP